MSDTDDDNTAGEYVLGTLDENERTAADARRTSDPSFDRVVSAWEARLAPLDEVTPEAEPAADLWQAILDRIGALGAPARVAMTVDRATSDARVVVLSRQLVRWRAMAAATMALAAGLALWIAVGPAGGSAGSKPQLIAVLLKGGDEPAYVMSVSLRNDSIAVRPVAVPTPVGKSYELWIIDPSIGAPKSLGVIDPATSVHKIPNGIASDVVTRATYAVTLEPLGGSPTSAPSAAPVFVGHAVDTP